MQISRAEAAIVIVSKIKEIKNRTGACTVALDGNSGAGKSTLAAQLAAASGAALFHMDDFFLPPALRTPERLASPGGNIDAERFTKEIIRGIAGGKAFYYRAFSCADFTYAPRRAPRRAVHILEGVYSTHPAWQDRLDLKIFLHVSPQVQRERILQRNGAEALRNFTETWIPMENRYFDFYKIRDICDYIVV